MDIMALIDRIEEALDAGRSLPLTRGRLIDVEKVYEIIDEIRANFPDELKQARWIVKERQEMLEEAEKEANRVLEEARDRADAMASEQEVVRRANEQAAAMLDAARQQRARDPARRGGLRRRDAREPRGQPRQAPDGRAARARPPAGQGQPAPVGRHP